MIFAWIRGSLRTRPGRNLGLAAGIAMTVALLTALHLFMRDSAASMTARAIDSVAADWQVELVPGADAAAIEQALRDAAPVRQVETVGYAHVDGFEFAREAIQTTGAGMAVGLAPAYRDAFPRGFRLLSGAFGGAVLQQQTAANLHAGPGDSITLHRPGLADAKVEVTGIIDLQTADSFFQAIGVPPGAAPQAPPDNAILMPLDAWQTLFERQATVRPDSVRTQLHIGLDHGSLPPDPGGAHADAIQKGHNFEARVAGSALLANNLAARLDAARGDGLYAVVLFYFLGTPGIALGALMSIAVAASGEERRRRDQSLLRLRGASIAKILRFAAAEALAMGLVGAVAGVILAEALTRLLFGHGLLQSEGAIWPLAISALAALALAIAAILVPAWRTARSLTVASARQTIGSMRRPIWRQIGLDLILLAVAGIVFWETAATGYQVVLATEGVSATSIDYTAFLAPVLLWLGCGLLVLRLADWGLDRGRKQIAGLLSAFVGPVSAPIAASIRRRRRRLAGGIALAALAFAFATSTAIFNTTYQAQARVDAELTNGADVTVTGSTVAPAASRIEALARIAGVAGVQAMQHRYAYVGGDLQDLYGIDAGTIGTATSLSDAFFSGGNASAVLAKLAATPSAILVSEETVTDYQLQPGDTLNLRLQGADHQYHVVPFTFAGVVREFPTAPRDSFLVANAAYVAEKTGVASREIVLMRVNGDLPSAKAAAIAATGDLPGARVTSLDDATHLIGSSLTAVDLSGLTRLELSFAALMVAGATGLVLMLGLADRRRIFVVLAVLGARRRDLAAFIWSEGALIVLGGAVIGTLAGLLVAMVLVKVLSGVFDPPPETIAIPLAYLLAMLGVSVVATGLAVTGTLHEARMRPLERLRDMA